MLRELSYPVFPFVKLVFCRFRSDMHSLPEVFEYGHLRLEPGRFFLVARLQIYSSWLGEVDWLSVNFAMKKDMLNVVAHTIPMTIGFPRPCRILTVRNWESVFFALKRMRGGCGLQVGGRSGYAKCFVPIQLSDAKPETDFRTGNYDSLASFFICQEKELSEYKPFWCVTFLDFSFEIRARFCCLCVSSITWMSLIYTNVINI